MVDACYSRRDENYLFGPRAVALAFANTRKVQLRSSSIREHGSGMSISRMFRNVVLRYLGI